MSKPALSDEEIYCTLDGIISTVSQYVPVGDRETSSFPDKEIMEQLQRQGYNPKTSWAFLRACYWYLADRKIMVVDPSNRYYLPEKITEDKKTDFCMEIFSKHERYLQANYARSLTEPNPYQMPEKAPDSSPGFQTNVYSGGK